MSASASVQHGMGPVCYAKSRTEAGQQDDQSDGTFCDLPFDEDSCDVVCSREGGTRQDNERWARKHVNIPQLVTVHSPDGFEWGYGGSGPADFALNVLEFFARRFYGKKPDFEAGRGEEGRCTAFAWGWHQDFKREFIAALPEEGGTIPGATIKAWMESRKPFENEAMDDINADHHRES